MRPKCEEREGAKTWPPFFFPPRLSQSAWGARPFPYVLPPIPAWRCLASSMCGAGSIDAAIKICIARALAMQFFASLFFPTLPQAPPRQRWGPGFPPATEPHARHQQYHPPQRRTISPRCL